MDKDTTRDANFDLNEVLEASSNADVNTTPETTTDEVAETPTVVEAPWEEQSGLVVDNSELKEETVNKPGYTGVTPETESHFDEYLKGMDSEYEALKAKAEEEEAEAEAADDENDDDTEYDDEEAKEEFNKKYNEAVVVIDKTGFGSIVNFTDEEREKLEKSKKIKLEEVETISLETLNIKKPKKSESVDTIIKKVTTSHSSNIVMPVSGYTATVRGCSAYELMTLIDQGENRLINAQNKWSLLHSKLESTSLGAMSFNDFLRNTASADYNILIYGLLCATYPDDDTIPLTCEHCNSTFEHNYSVRSLIRAEAMSEKLQDLIMKTVDSSIVEELAIENHNNSPINKIKRIKLPYTGYIVELYIQSAYDLINKSIKDLDNEEDSKYEQAAILSTMVKTIYIPDAEDGSYYEISKSSDITKIVYNLNEIDLRIIRKMGEELLEDITMDFGIMNITCPKCGHFTPSLSMDLESILFYRYRQAMTTTIE